MFNRARIDLWWKSIFVLTALVPSALSDSIYAQDKAKAPPAATAEKTAEKTAAKSSDTTGQKVFSAGHSFHVFVPGILTDMAKGAGIQNHVAVGLSAIGGSRVIQHWDVADEKNKAKDAL